MLRVKKKHHRTLGCRQHRILRTNLRPAGGTLPVGNGKVYALCQQDNLLEKTRKVLRCQSSHNSLRKGRLNLASNVLKLRYLSQKSSARQAAHIYYTNLRHITHVSYSLVKSRVALFSDHVDETRQPSYDQVTRTFRFRILFSVLTTIPLFSHVCC